MSKNFGGPIRTDTTGTVTLYGSKSVQKKNDIATSSKSTTRTEDDIRTTKIANGEYGPTRISREFAQALVDGRRKFNTEDKSFTQIDLARKAGLPLQIIQEYEKVDTIIDNNFNSNCSKIKKALGLDKLPKLITPKLNPNE